MANGFGSRSTPHAASAATCKVRRQDRSERDMSSAKEPVTFAASPDCGTENAADGHFRRCGSSTTVGRSQPYPALTLNSCHNSTGTGYIRDWLHLSTPGWQRFSLCSPRPTRKLRKAVALCYPLPGVVSTIRVRGSRHSASLLRTLSIAPRNLCYLYGESASSWQGGVCYLCIHTALLRYPSLLAMHVSR
ncbi:hypothetical protein P171DRAFT_435703 [Karstenula rhodostoma CBS 690.94]|uniref:Uncharacterized protein n=1 Tax=Karstenula rhodostoma CBS 690.94 TaxID=1392251 RepID=A0A9P4P9K5_9PLEO|nr:hypothetical protein P171DRAFT_435703 [Karstenula rhodostoma CBS 690.94]